MGEMALSGDPLVRVADVLADEVRSLRARLARVEALAERWKQGGGHVHDCGVALSEALGEGGA